MWKRLRDWWLSRARAARMETPAAPDPPASDPELIEKFARQAHDLDAVRKSVEDAAALSAGLWLSYLFVLLYIGIAAGAVTHKDLLLENSVKLPFLNVDCRSSPFSSWRRFSSSSRMPIRSSISSCSVRRWACLTPSFERSCAMRRKRGTGCGGNCRAIFSYNFSPGLRDIRDGGLGWFLKAVAWISLVAGPVLLLLLIQAQFLPYHLEWVTWVQRFAVLADVVLLWLLWHAVVDSRSDIKWPPLWRHKITSLVSLVPMGLAFTAATFPGEGLDEWIGKRQWIPPYPSAKWSDQKDRMSFLTTWYGQEGWTSVHDLLFNGKVDDVTRRRRSLFSNTLVLPALTRSKPRRSTIRRSSIASSRHLVLRGRHLEGAVFTSADLRKADFESAQLRDARLSGAHLQGASLREAQLQGASLREAQLQDARLDYAQLQSASLFWAQLQGASLYSAKLQGASFPGAQLQRADLTNAQLQGASLYQAKLQGASLDQAQLQGASPLCQHNVRHLSL
jgi:pentapeptide repeat protein